MPPANTQLNLRHTFVAMLFALVASHLALSTAALLQTCVQQCVDVSRLVAPASHLFLALTLITTSWVGWSASTTSKSAQQLTNVFQKSFIVLIFDILLVIVYFAMTASVEMDIQKLVILAPSATEEVLFISITFGMYFLWDIIYDVWMKLPSKRDQVAKHVFVFSFASMTVFVLSLFVLWLDELGPRTGSTLSVYSTDVALTSLVVGFRALKGAEFPLAKMVKLSNPDRYKRKFEWQGRVVVYGVIYLLGIVFMQLGHQWS
jgi:hypothetical protein